MIGHRLGRLEVRSRIGSRNGNVYWRCVCDCGAERELSTNHLRFANVRSCGCLRREVSAARMTKLIDGLPHDARTKKSWAKMIERCYSPKDISYKNYGARGIKVCDRWRTFVAFYEDMGPRPDGMSLDRINGDGDYEPGNCRWATRTEQNSRKRDTRWAWVGGERVCMKEAARRLGIDYGHLRYLTTEGAWAC